MELKLLLFPVFELEDSPALKEELLLFELLLDVDISVLRIDEFRLDEDPNLDFARTEFEKELLDGLGGSIKALADTCLCYKLQHEREKRNANMFKQLKINYFLETTTILFDSEPDSFRR